MKTLTLQEISRRVAPDSAQEISQALDRAFQLIHNELTAGNRIDLPHRIVVSVDGGGATSSTLMSPPVASARTPVAAPTIEPAPDAYGILLAVPSRDFFSDAISRRLTGPKSKVEILEGKSATLAKIQDQIPHLMVIDANMPETADLIREVKSNKESSLIAVITICGEGTDPSKVEGMKICEDESIVEPFELNDLVRLAEGELARSIEERGFFLHEIHFQFQTTESCIEQANEMVTNFLQQVEGMSEEGAAAMSVAFREAVDNAARHGNKNQEKRIIDGIYLLDQEKVTITVEDEGDGFDTELYIRRGKDGNAVAAARQRNLEGRAGGLGIMLMLKCVDDLQYNYAGNQIRLTKYVR